MDTGSKKNSKNKIPHSFFYQTIICFWLIIVSVVVYLKYNERQVELSDWNSSVSAINDVVAAIYSESDSVDTQFDNMCDLLCRTVNYEYVYFTIRDLYNGNVIVTNDRESEYFSDDYNEDSLFCRAVVAGEVQPYGMRKYYDGKQRVYRVSKYPDLGITVSTEIVLNSHFRSDASTRNNLYIIVLIIFGVIITLLLVLYMLRFNNSVKRLYMMLAKIYKNQDPSDLLQNFHWNKNVDYLANAIVKTYADKIKIIEAHYTEKEKSFEQEQHDMHAKRIMTNNLRHELKTPIGIISGYIETIIEHPDLPKELQNKFLNNCLRNVRRINNLVTSLSLLSRLEDGADAILYEDINLYKTLCEISEEFTPKLREAKMKFNLDIPEDTNVLSSNSSLYAIFNNLIKNAINYSGGTEMGLTLLSEDEQFYKFSFWDNGVGVDSEHIDRIFDQFFRVEKDVTHATDGTGLGLSIVKLVIDNHGGDIMVRNRDEGGLEFMFTLPKVLVKEADESKYDNNNEFSKQ
ncbi:MAG: HAMP domain-containing histidine kinase [Muribaculaceae bacterium]|nr:HAMP domain-containing histidine kinase [Muribaculaceae bacterium]